MGLPKDFIKKVAGRYGGRRLTKAPKTLSIPVLYPLQPIGRRYRDGTKNPHHLSQGLVKADYRYWVGSYGSTLGRTLCRGCGRVEFNRKMREAHLKEGCRNKLDSIYDFLKKKRLCAICSFTCKKGKWGVMLCPGVCRNRWRHQSTGIGFNTAELFFKEEIVPAAMYARVN